MANIDLVIHDIEVKPKPAKVKAKDKDKPAPIDEQKPDKESKKDG